MYIAHISDLHFNNSSSEPELNANKLVDAINNSPFRPDFVVVTGDLVNEYDHNCYDKSFSCLNKLKMPYYFACGNCDDVELLKEAIELYGRNHPKSDCNNSLQYVVELEELVLIVIDNSLWNEVEGDMTDENLNWLEDQLEVYKGRKIMLATHRYPFASKLMVLEGKKPAENNKLCELIAKYKDSIKLMITGHLHFSVASSVAGVPVISTFSPFIKNSSRQIASVGRLENLAFHMHQIEYDRVNSFIINV